MNAVFVAWRPIQPELGWRPVGRLEHSDGLYRFCYTRGAQREPFEPFRGMENLNQIYESADLFPLFANRLLPASRPEYESFLRWSGLGAGEPLDPIVVLGVTEGIRETDAIEVFPSPAQDVSGHYLNKFFLHGIRWLAPASAERIKLLRPNEPLKLLADFQNSYDPRAVAVRTTDNPTLVGYVPRYLANDVWRLVRGGDADFMELSVERVNLDAPLQNRVLCRMYATWPDGFTPCSGDDFEPISSRVPAHSAG